MLTAQVAFLRVKTDFKNRRAVTVPNITRRNTRRAYERVYADDTLMNEYLTPERLDFYEEVTDLCAPWRPRSVIDLGCGTGNLLHAIVQRTSPIRVVGIDHAAAGILRARQLVPSGEFEARDMYELDCDETFELVLCTEVLEHLANPDSIMRVLTRLCASTGAIVITVPDGAVDSWEGHRNFWTEPELATFLQKYGRVDVSRMPRAETTLLAVVRPRLAERESAADGKTLPF
jgi:2-polyprenyl-3-methyl-5-hydroxy-6-metoxy-1,4-benzoquinol methylase